MVSLHRWGQNSIIAPQVQQYYLVSFNLLSLSFLRILSRTRKQWVLLSTSFICAFPWYSDSPCPDYDGITWSCI